MPASARGVTLPPVTSATPYRENARSMDVVDVILRDGSTLRLRPPVRAGAPASSTTSTGTENITKTGI